MLSTVAHLGGAALVPDMALKRLACSTESFAGGTRPSATVLSMNAANAACGRQAAEFSY